MSIDGVKQGTRRPDFRNYELQFGANPWDDYRALMQDGGVAYAAEHNGFWAVLSYEAVREAAADPGRFTTTGGASIPRTTDPEYPAIPLELDPPDNREYRRLLQDGLRPAQVAAFEPMLRARVTACIDAFCERGEADLRAELGKPIPILTLADLLGLPEDDAKEFQGWVDAFVSAASSDNSQAMQEAVGKILGYIHQKVAEATEQPVPGLLSDLVNSEIAGERLNPGKAAGMAFLLIAAGAETTINGISSAMYTIGSRPELRDRLAADPSLIPAAIEEVLRTDSPVHYMGRTAVSTFEFRGRTMEAGERVALMWGAANHDATKFPDPDKFDVDRDARGHLAFGHGVHRCVGEHLARLEMKVCIEEVLRRLPDFRTLDPLEISRDSFSSRGPRTVRVAFTPAPRSGN
ncbi:cytochrome P450 [Georgenia sp. AZ-5]|uniref:cytochrome P450 n=1 Tax=Georgenia sp. AZ-5 TaxID=3367526 RepID=UPI003754F4EB